MDKKRLEEFRNKLRQGKSVRVVNGQIQLDDEAATAADTPTTTGTPATTKPSVSAATGEARPGTSRPRRAGEAS